MAITLDCQGLDCPGPVLRCMDCLEKDNPDSLAVLVDSPAAVENVGRLLTGKGYALSTTHADGRWTLSASRDATAPQEAAPNACASLVNAALSRSVVFITSDGIGSGDPDLGGRLMLNFLGTLPELGPSLWRVILVNGAVKLACTGHPALEKLQALAASGVGILVCGTCLGFFDLTERKAVGETTNMLDVVTSLAAAAKVIQV